MKNIKIKHLQQGSEMKYQFILDNSATYTVGKIVCQM
jgi:hypothetical protein